MKANATVFVPLPPGDQIKSARQLIHDARCRAGEIRYVPAIKSKNSLVGCEAQDVYEVDSELGKTVYGVIDSGGKFRKLENLDAATAEACRE